MTEAEARAILGIPPTATIAQAKKAHRDLAKVFHPDRHANSTPEEVQRATDAMARINQALDLLIQLEADGRLGMNAGAASSGAGSSGAASSGFRYSPHGAGPDECFLCGAQPAAQATFRGYGGFLFWFSRYKYDGSFCRSCGLALFRECQTRNFTRGWWGIVIVPMLISAVANLTQWQRLRRLGDPAFRDPAVITPMSFPVDPGRPVLQKPTVWAASIVAILILGVWLGGAGSSTSSTARTNTTTSGSSGTTSNVPAPITVPSLSGEDLAAALGKTPYDVGSCWSSPDSQNMIGPIRCDDPDAMFVVSKAVYNDVDCPSDTSGTTTSDTGAIACLRVRP